MLTLLAPCYTPPQSTASPALAAGLPSIITVPEPAEIARPCGGCFGLSGGTKGSLAEPQESHHNAQWMNLRSLALAENHHELYLNVLLRFRYPYSVFIG